MKDNQKLLRYLRKGTLAKADLIKTGKGRLARQLNVPNLISSFLAAQDVREISKNAYRKGLEKLCSWLEFEKITQPDREDILRFKAYLVDEDLAANTVNSYMGAVKRFFAYLEGSKQYPTDIAKGIKGVQQPKNHLRESLTISQVKDILSMIDIATIQGKRNYALVNLMARTGLRTIEVVRANIEDIKQQGGEALLFIQGKGRDSKDEIAVLVEKTLKPILAYLKTRGKVDPKAPLFASLSDRNKGQRLTTKTLRGLVKGLLRKINIDNPKLCAHSLRHFFITESLRAGAPPIQVQHAARHASFATTEKYLHNFERTEKGAERYLDF